MRLVWITVVLVAWVHPVSAELPRTFLEERCFQCHGPSVQQASRRFDQLSDSIADLAELELWQDIVDQLNLRAMPPKGQAQPESDEVIPVVQTMTTAIAEAQSRLAGKGRHTPMRRLNAWEYRQTLGDLLGIDMTTWNPTKEFPPEAKVGGFDNNGAELVTSGQLLDHYLRTADEAITRTTHFEAKPDAQEYVQKSPFYFKGKRGSGLPKTMWEDRFRYISDAGYTDLTGRYYRGGHIGFHPLVDVGVPTSGIYTVRVLAAAIDREHHYDVIDDFPNGDPLVLEVVEVDRRGSGESTGNVSRERSLGTVELTNEEPEWFSFDVYMRKGFEPEIRFHNGPESIGEVISKLLQSTNPKPEILPFARGPRVDRAAVEPRNHELLKVYRGPKLRVWEVQVAGPHGQEWPPRGHRLLYGSLTPEDLTRPVILDRLRSFAEVAFRKPLRKGELAAIETLVVGKLDEGMDALSALQLGFQSILCSPSFLYLQEGEGRLNDFALASRLSYFLWSSAPDDELLKLAAGKKLSDAGMLREQVERMLEDERSQRFVEDFI